MVTITGTEGLNPKFDEQLRKLAEFVGCDRIEYRDLGKGENYILHKDGKVLVLKVWGNQYDGGFLSVDDKV